MTLSEGLLLHGELDFRACAGVLVLMRIAAALVVVFLSVPGGALEAREFGFQNFVGLKPGNEFLILIQGRPAGSGNIRRLTSHRLVFSFQLEKAGQRIEGHVELHYIGRNQRDYLLRLRYSGKRLQVPEKTDEIVQADSFLADNGILTFKYLKNTRFLQLSRLRTTKIVTDWGVAELKSR